MLQEDIQDVVGAILLCWQMFRRFNKKSDWIWLFVFYGFWKAAFLHNCNTLGGGVIILNLNEYLLLTVAFKVLWFWNKHIWWNIFYLYIEKITLDPKQCLDCVFNKLYCNNALFHLWKLCKNIFRQTTMVNFTYFHFSHFLALEMFHLHDIVTNWPYKLPYIVSFL